MANQGKRMVSEDQIKKLEGLADIREAGDGITIAGGVISAQGGVEYTAGTGIEITAENVINNTAPAKALYEHNLTIRTTTDLLVFSIINDKNTPFSAYSDIYDYLVSNNFTFNAFKQINGFSSSKVINCIYYDSAQIRALATDEIKTYTSFSTIVDTVTQII